MTPWDDRIPSNELAIYRKAGFRVDCRAGTDDLGARPALLVIDVLYAFVGERDEPAAASVRDHPLSCGAYGWAAVRRIETILPAAREREVPIVYGVGDPSLPRKWTGRNPRAREAWQRPRAGEVVDEVAPRPGDMVIRKYGPSIFHQTPLINILASQGIDTLLVCGGVTGGCIRASVVDAASYGFTVGVISDGTFDRGPFVHGVNLFDMNAKYASVITTSQAQAYLAGIPPLGLPRLK